MKKELSELRKSNPGMKFRIAFCKDSGVKVIQTLYFDGWLCLHN